MCADWTSPSARSLDAVSAEPSSPDTEGVTPVGVLMPLMGMPPLHTPISSLVSCLLKCLLGWHLAPKT